MNSIDEARRLRVLADDQKIPTGKGPALLAPASNEQSASPYWPAALPDVIGVACLLAGGDEEILPVDVSRGHASSPPSRMSH
jgi:hypothetical protein